MKYSNFGSWYRISKWDSRRIRYNSHIIYHSSNWFIIFVLNLDIWIKEGEITTINHYVYSWWLHSQNKNNPTSESKQTIEKDSLVDRICSKHWLFSKRKVVGVAWLPDVWVRLDTKWSKCTDYHLSSFVRALNLFA